MLLKSILDLDVPFHELGKEIQYLTTYLRLDTVRDLVHRLCRVQYFDR